MIELLVVIAIIGIIAGVLLPTLSSGREEAYKLECAANLKSIIFFGMLYAKEKTRAYPLASEKDPESHLSLQVLVDYFPDDFEPALFVCSSGDALPAEEDEDGRFVLDADTCAYAWVGRRTKTTAKKKALSSDKYVDEYEDDDGQHSGHPRGMNVLNTNGSVLFWDMEKLDPDTMLPKGLVR